MALDKFRRTNFLKEDVNGDGIAEWDLLLSNWDLFETTQPLRFDTVKYGDIQRPDVLSFRIYGTSSFWWVLCKFNQIDDVWNDLYVGMELLVPDPKDVRDYYTKVRRRIRNV